MSTGGIAGAQLLATGVLQRSLLSKQMLIRAVQLPSHAHSFQKTTCRETNVHLRVPFVTSGENFCHRNFCRMLLPVREPKIPVWMKIETDSLEYKPGYTVILLSQYDRPV